MKAKIYKSNGKGTVYISPSKSYAHRLLIASALSNEKSTIRNVVFCSDILETFGIMKFFNKKIVISGDSRKKLKISNGPIEYTKDDKITVNCLESGSTLRFMVPILLSRFNDITFNCSKRLIKRGINDYKDIFKDQDITIETVDNKIKVKGHLKSGNFKINGSNSSQYLTAMLMTAPILDGNSVIEFDKLTSKNYIDITLDVLEKSGIEFKKIGNKFIIPGNQIYHGLSYKVEGDYSNASYFEFLNYFGSKIKIKGLVQDSLQGDKVYIDYFKKLSQKNSKLDIENCIDLGPVLFSFAALNKGGTFINTNRLKLKESNRISSMKEELAKFNVVLEESDNQVKIINTNITPPTAMINSHNDHRITMALSIMLTKFGGEIEGIEAVKKSYPDFFTDLKKINIRLELID